MYDPYEDMEREMHREQKMEELDHFMEREEKDRLEAIEWQLEGDEYKDLSLEELEKIRKTKIEEMKFSLYKLRNELEMDMDYELSNEHYEDDDYF